MMATGSLKSTWPRAHTTGTSCPHKQAAGVIWFRTPASAAAPGTILHMQEPLHGSGPCAQGGQNNRGGSFQKATPLHQVHLAKGTRGTFPSQAEMLNSLPLRESSNATDLIIIHPLPSRG